MTEKQL